MNKNIGILAGIIVIAGIGFIALSGETVKDTSLESTSNQPELTKSADVETEMLNETSMTEDTSVPPTEASILPAPEEAAEAIGSFETYSAEKVATATGDVVIFFHATWCPSCRVLVSDIEKNASSIPAGTTILKADYDKETELKKKYGVTTQHTLVQIDTDGNLIKKWSGGSKLTNLLSEIQ